MWQFPNNLIKSFNVKYWIICVNLYLLSYRKHHMCRSILIILYKTTSMSTLTCTVELITTVWAFHSSVTHRAVADTEAVITSEFITFLAAFISGTVQITIMAFTESQINILKVRILFLHNYANNNTQGEQETIFVST